jgi:hypothetical protein
VFGRFATENNRLEENLGLRLNERHKIGVAFNYHHRNLLSRIALLIGMREQIYFIAGFNMEHHILEGNTTLLRWAGQLRLLP